MPKLGLDPLGSILITSLHFLFPSQQHLHLPNPSTSIHTLFVGLLTIFISLITGSLFQYFNPSHNLLVLIFSCVTGSGTYEDKSSKGGGFRPARVTEERKPEVWRARVSVRIMLLEGTEVRPRRAREAF